MVVHLDARFCKREEDGKLGDLLCKLNKARGTLRLKRKHAVECRVVIVTRATRTVPAKTHGLGVGFWETRGYTNP